MPKHIFIIAALMIFSMSSCRDYLTDIVDTTPPVIYTNSSGYQQGDTVVVTLTNKSTTDIYVTGTYNTIEKNNSSSWDVYAVINCNGGCPEFALYGKNSITARVVFTGNAGTYRFTCSYSTMPGVIFSQKSTVYSNEFTIQ
jgi:hypothetical protein